MIKVSVIVPVYNVEKYLGKCLDTLLSQTLSEIEIIIVNDGATDSSQKIIDEYVARSDKIKAFQKKNGGLSDARNYGLQYATGEYIGYVDSDDYVEPEMFELMYSKAKERNSDIVECNLRHTYQNSEDVEIGKKLADKHEMIMFGRSVVWNKIYNREWLLSTHVTFHKGVIYEDVEFFLELVPYIRTYDYVEEALIHYVQRISSINNLSSKKTMDIIQILDAILHYYKDNGFYEEYKESLEFLFTRILLCSSFSRMCRIANQKERRQALEANWKMLVHSYPEWKKNKILGRTLNRNALFMRSVNTITYRIYSGIFPVVYRLWDKMIIRKGYYVN